MAQLSSLLIFPTAASQDTQNRLVKAVQLLQNQNQLVWDALCCRESDDAGDRLYDTFFGSREQVASELNKLQELIPKTQLERYVGKICGDRECWMPVSCACGRGRSLNSGAAKEVLQQLRHANRLLSTMFGVVSVETPARQDIVARMHQLYRHEEDGGISALRKLGKDTLDCWAGIAAALEGAGPLPLDVPVGEVSAVVDRMLKESKDHQRASSVIASASAASVFSLQGGLTPAGSSAATSPGVAAAWPDEDHGYFQYRWYTFLVLYHDLARLLERLQRATAAWVESDPELSGSPAAAHERPKSVASTAAAPPAAASAAAPAKSEGEASLQRPLLQPP